MCFFLGKWSILPCIPPPINHTRQWHAWNFKRLICFHYLFLLLFKVISLFNCFNHISRSKSINSSIHSMETNRYSITNQVAWKIIHFIPSFFTKKRTRFTRNDSIELIGIQDCIAAAPVNDIGQQRPVDEFRPHLTHPDVIGLVPAANSEVLSWYIHQCRISRKPSSAADTADGCCIAFSERPISQSVAEHTGVDG